jgi:hypothetical protein
MKMKQIGFKKFFFLIFTPIFIFLIIKLNETVKTKTSSQELKKQIQKILNENKIDIVIEELDINLNAKNLLQGKVENIRAKLFIPKLNEKIELKTDIHYKFHDKKLFLNTENLVLNTNDFKNLKPSIFLTLSNGFELHFNLSHSEPIEKNFKDINTKTNAFNLSFILKHTSHDSELFLIHFASNLKNILIQKDSEKLIVSDLKSSGTIETDFKENFKTKDLKLNAFLHQNTLFNKIIFNNTTLDIRAKVEKSKTLSLDGRVSVFIDKAKINNLFNDFHLFFNHTKIKKFLSKKGIIKIGTLKLNDLPINNLNFDFEIKKDKILFFLKNLKFNFFNFSNINTNYNYKTKDYKIELQAKSQRIPIQKIQKAFCLAYNKTIEGTLQIDFNKILIQDKKFFFDGKIFGTIFKGDVEINNLKLDFTKTYPQITLSAYFKNLNLGEIGAFTHFGDMRGLLDIELINATYALTEIGPIPIEYDFSIKNTPNVKAYFYGRAVHNLLELFGTKKENLPWFVQTPIHFVIIFRNLFPASAEYFGFRAKSTNGFTEIYTFDSKDSKSHYLLYGRGIKIPLRSHNHYPVIMKTDAFQGWLWGMVEYFINLSKQKNKMKEESICIPDFTEVL